MIHLLFAALLLQWKPLQPGVELTVVDGLYVVRVDPQRAHLAVALASESGGAPRTAAAWCRKANLAVAINAGMFASDQRSNVGYLRHGTHLNNARFNDYRSVVALNPGVLWLDLDRDKDDLAKYDVVIQNLRLIAGDRRNVWAPSARRWSEAALALDSRGRLLFLFSRAPFTMRDFNSRILALPLDVTRAMHLEGGPEASLSIHVPGFDLDLCGSFETGFREDDTNAQQWPIPNVLGVLR
ncbi:MAG TPA: phosphodiester glycosidase family protein [Thermoanaerobaculia bacterium]|nr:phosphodiester glycosidase family protein [Thermoanaerobaculia bacterium]